MCEGGSKEEAPRLGVGEQVGFVRMETGDTWKGSLGKGTAEGGP